MPIPPAVTLQNRSFALCVRKTRYFLSGCSRRSINGLITRLHAFIGSWRAPDKYGGPLRTLTGTRRYSWRLTDREFVNWRPAGFSPNSPRALFVRIFGNYQTQLSAVNFPMRYWIIKHDRKRSKRNESYFKNLQCDMFIPSSMIIFG